VKTVVPIFSGVIIFRSGYTLIGPFATYVNSVYHH